MTEVDGLCNMCGSEVEVEENGIGSGIGICICEGCYPKFSRNNFEVVK